MRLGRLLTAVVGALAAVVTVAPTPAATAAPAVDTIPWGQQAQIPGVGGSSDAPSVTSCYSGATSGIYMVWKGLGSDQRLFLNKFDRQGNWGNQQVLPFGGSSTTPSIACGRGVMMIVWKGIGTDERIFWSTSADGGVTWSPQTPVNESFALTDIAPTVTWRYEDGFDDNLDFPPVLSFRGAGSDRSVYTETFNPVGRFWDGPGAVPGAFTDTTPRVSYWLSGSTVDTIGVVWKGVNDNHFWYQHQNLNVTWNPQPVVVAADGGTSNAPDVTVGGEIGRPLMAWKGIDPDQKIYLSLATRGCLDPTQPQCWQPQQQVTSVGGTSGGPGVAQLGIQRPDGSSQNAVVLVWKGVPGDQRLFYSVGTLPS